MLATEAGSNVTRATFLDFIGRYDDADRAVDEAVGERKALRKTIKGAGINLAAFDRARADAEKSGEKRDEENRQYLRFLGFLGKPPGFQASFDLDTGDDEDLAALNTHELKAVDNQGLDAGKGGRRRDSNPWTPGSEAYQRWDAAWIRGQGEIASTLKDGDANGATAPKRRGRPRKVQPTLQ
jgi:hypothetical protein